MPTYVAFLRAINLASRRKFGKDDIRRCVESLPATEVETYINTGNVRFTSTMRSRTKIEAGLEATFLADRGFEVPTVVFTPDELRQIATDADELGADLGEGGRHFVSLLKDEPSAEGIRQIEQPGRDGERCVVRGRAAHMLIDAGEYQASRLNNAVAERHLGVATNRNLTVIKALEQKWC